MRYEKGRKDASRSRIMEVATERFRSDGIAATGLAGIMSEAGLTNGAFYPHFQSKAALVRECVCGGSGGSVRINAGSAGGWRPGDGHRRVSVGGAPGQSREGLRFGRAVAGTRASADPKRASSIPSAC